NKIKRLPVLIVFIACLFNVTLYAQGCYSTSLTPSGIQFPLTGGSTNIGVSFPSGGCSSPTITVYSVPEWLNIYVSGTNISVSTTSSLSSGYREASIPVRVNGNTVNGFMVKQGTEPPPPPPPSCSVTGFNVGSFDHLGETKVYPLTFSNCSSNSAYFNFKTYDIQPSPARIIHSRPGASSSVTCHTNTIGIATSVTDLGTATIGGNSVTIGSQIIQNAYNNTVKHGLTNDNLVYAQVPRIP